MDLTGFVGNDTSGVFIEVEGAAADARGSFVAALSEEPPPLARVDRVRTAALTALGGDGIHDRGERHRGQPGRAGHRGRRHLRRLSREIRDPAERRFGYAFTNCTNCGPRYTIVRDVPYDRASTRRCPHSRCARRAGQSTKTRCDRRFHAQPVCCPDCGPSLRLVDASGAAIDGEPIAATATWLRDGKIIAVKGLGGYHLAAAASNEVAVSRLRSRKHREDRPFALMVADLAAARELCVVNDDEARLLERPGATDRAARAPRPTARYRTAVAPRTRELGLMLPYTPLHHLLLDEFGRAARAHQRQRLRRADRLRR